jgi:hypothetical protein
MRHGSRIAMAAALLCLLSWTTTEADERPGDPPQRDVSDVVAAFELNHADADENYVGRTLYVTGQVARIYRKPAEGETPGECAYVVEMEHHRGRGNDYRLRFSFAAKDRKTLAEVKPGRTVTLAAICAGEEALAIRFDGGKLIQIHPEAAHPPVSAAAASPYTPSTSPYATPDFGPGVPMAAPPFPPAVPAPRR